ncbi:MAG TPA: glutamine-hydrolyzing carbamoyl-phosphate synthase small subunit [Actinomycetota bacterium]|nr:glutamine-hydrolyzing carbamoyl-phosphate synthase small subunit [Actinomycetota bacterium]
MSDALLALADGTVFRGRAWGAEGETFGEVVFNTSLTGYQEVLTDPSYHGQVVAMTYPHQGSYGVNALDEEAPRPWVSGFIIRDGVERPSSWRATEGLRDYLVRNGIVAIEGVDTRALTRRLRLEGAMTGGVTTLDIGEDEFVERVRSAPPLVGRDLVREVTARQPYDVDAGELLASGLFDPSIEGADPRVQGAKVAAIDYGMKRNILRCLVGLGFEVRVFPATTPAAEVLAWGPDGVFLSNGPGDPSALPYAIENIRAVLDSRTPTFGICLGHQLLGTALGATTYKLKFGHRGANHPVKSLVTGRVEITSHNHGFAVKTGLDPTEGGEAWQVLARSKADDWVWRSRYGDVALTHFDLNDGTLEGVRALEIPAYSVQYHPEAAPGPHDSRYLFAEFVELIAGRTDAGR